MDSPRWIRGPCSITRRRAAARRSAGDRWPAISRADYYVTGSVVSAGGRLLVPPRFTPRRGGVVAKAETRQGRESDLFELVDDLVRQLLAGRSSRPSSGWRGWQP